MDKQQEISIEVAYALAHKQKINQLRVPAGTNARQAAQLSGLDAMFPELDLDTNALGVFSRTLARPEEYQVQEGDRIELYRPLLADPKEARKRRAEKAAAQAAPG